MGSEFESVKKDALDCYEAERAEAEAERKKSGGPAFPGGGFASQYNPGMSLRDWFAGQAAAGYMAHTGPYGLSSGPDGVAERSYQIADAMLAERERVS